VSNPYQAVPDIQGICGTSKMLMIVDDNFVANILRERHPSFLLMTNIDSQDKSD